MGIYLIKACPQGIGTANGGDERLLLQTIDSASGFAAPAWYFEAIVMQRSYRATREQRRAALGLRLPVIQPAQAD